MSELDNLVMKEGKELNGQYKKVSMKGNLAYDDNFPLASNKNMPTSADIKTDEESAKQNLIEQAALLKLKKEKEAYGRMSEDEKVKDYICQAVYYKSTNDWFKKYGYEMSGSQKRSLKRDIERQWAKGKYKVTEEQRTDILYELSKASNQQPTQQPQQTKEDKVASHISDLNSLMFKA